MTDATAPIPMTDDEFAAAKDYNAKYADWVAKKAIVDAETERRKKR